MALFFRDNIAFGMSQEEQMAIRQELMRLRTADPAKDLEIALKQGDYRFVGLMSYALMVPGVDQDLFHKNYEHKFGFKVIKGTSKEPRPAGRGFCKPRGNLSPLRYELPFLPALPSGASWQIFVIISRFLNRRRLLGLEPPMPNDTTVSWKKRSLTNLSSHHQLNRYGPSSVLICAELYLTPAYSALLQSKFEIGPYSPSWSRSQGNPDCGRRTSTVLSCAFREQRDALAARPSLHCHPDKVFSVIFFSLPNSWRDGRGRPQVRASNEGLLRTRVPRAQRSPLRPAPPLLPPRHVISLLNQTSHHRISVWRIRLQWPIGAAH